MNKIIKHFESRYALTFGEVSILHIGGKELGKGIRDTGFSTEELIMIRDNFISKKLEKCVEYISISDNLPKELRCDNEAGVLIIRSNNSINNTIPISKDFADRLYKEQSNIEYDAKYWDTRRRSTLNKRARKNIVFGKDEIIHSDDYKQYSIKAFRNLPELNKLKKLLSKIFGKRAKNLNAEGNHYHHDKSRIGYHGDSERKIVICISLGKSSILRYNWRLPGSSEHTLKPITIILNHGDIYIMSEKATGFDWRKRSKVRVVHGAGYKMN